MSRSVDNIDFGTFPVDRNVFGKDSDSSFAFEVVGIKYLVAEVLSLTEEIACQHHFVHERCLAVVHMCDNRDVPYILHKSFT